MSVQAFQEQLQVMGIRGCAYSSVWSYLKGRTEPPSEFVDAVASMLDVRREWLLWEQGEMLEAAIPAAAVIAGRAARDGGDGSLNDKEMERALISGLPALQHAGRSSWIAVVSAFQAYMVSDYGMRVNAGAYRGGKASQFAKDLRKRHAAIAKQIAKSIGELAALPGVDLSSIPAWQIARFIELAAQALQMLFVMPHRLTAAPVSRASVIKKEDVL